MERPEEWVVAVGCGRDAEVHAAVELHIVGQGVGPSAADDDDVAARIVETEKADDLQVGRELLRPVVGARCARHVLGVVAGAVRVGDRIGSGVDAETEAGGQCEGKERRNAALDVGDADAVAGVSGHGDHRAARRRPIQPARSRRCPAPEVEFGADVDAADARLLPGRLGVGAVRVQYPVRQPYETELDVVGETDAQVGVGELIAIGDGAIGIGRERMYPNSVLSVWKCPASTVKGTSVMSGRSVVISRIRLRGVGFKSV
ncbi:MAG: hypothetical protein WDN31_07765 [Hyphomicrobium sp.]